MPSRGLPGRLGRDRFALAKRTTTNVSRARMEDRSFFVALVLAMLVLAAGEIAYGVYGPFSASGRDMMEFSSRNRLR